MPPRLFGEFIRYEADVERQVSATKRAEISRTRERALDDVYASR